VKRRIHDPIDDGAEAAMYVHKVLLDAHAQLIMLVVGQHCTRVVAARGGPSFIR
jgi:hypothetical protein